MCGLFFIKIKKVYETKNFFACLGKLKSTSIDVKS